MLQCQNSEKEVSVSECFVKRKTNLLEMSRYDYFNEEGKLDERVEIVDECSVKESVDKPTISNYVLEKYRQVVV